eukprot:Colp12_sorted_trinity150504_noHs@33035
MEHTRRQDFCLGDGQLLSGDGKRPQLVDGEEAGRAEEEVVEEGLLHEHGGSVHDHEDVEQNVEPVHVPEQVEVHTADRGLGEDIDEGHDSDEEHAGDASDRVECPPVERGQEIRLPLDLTEEARDIDRGLGAEVVEVDRVAHAVHDHKQKASPSTQLVEANHRIKRNETVQRGGTEEGDCVAAHGDEEQGEAEHHAGCSTPGGRHTIPGNAPQTTVLSLNRVSVRTLSKDHTNKQEETEGPEDLKTVVAEDSVDASDERSVRGHWLADGVLGQGQRLGAVHGTHVVVQTTVLAQDRAEGGLKLGAGGALVVVVVTGRGESHALHVGPMYSALIPHVLCVDT